MAIQIVVLGAGITGLATAYVLAPKYAVTIIARDLPGDINLNWASPWAGAVFQPQKQATKSQQQMQTTSFNFYRSLAHQDPSSGVAIYPMTEYFDDLTTDSTLWYKSLMPDYRVLPSTELPSGVSFGVKYTSLAMNPTFLLPWLKKKLTEKGVRFIRAEVKSLDDAVARAGRGADNILINASGVGARELANDETVGPIRGQTMFVQTNFGELIMWEGKEYTYVIPRPKAGGVIMGGIKSDRLDADIDVALKSDILARVNHITGGAFKGLKLEAATDIIGFRPGRKDGVRVEKEGRVVHAYGAGGAGYIYSFGVAERVKEIIEGGGIAAKL